MNKKMAWLLAAPVVLLITVNALAQTPVPADKNDNQQVKTIFSFKNQIGLTDDQETKLKALLYDEQSTVEANANTLKALGADLNKMIEDKQDMKDIRAKLEQMSKIQIDTTCLNIEDGRKIEAILTPDQMAKWKNIQKSFSSQQQS